MPREVSFGDSEGDMPDGSATGEEDRMRIKRAGGGRAGDWAGGHQVRAWK